MTLIDLTNVRDVAMIEPLDATDVAGVSCSGGACHIRPSDVGLAALSENPEERARG